MSRGRKKIPTRLKELRGTNQKCRTIKNEFTPSLLANIPDPPFKLTEIALREYYIIASELLGKKMLYNVDLSLLCSYCREIGTYIEMETILQQTGRIDEFYNEDGILTRRQMRAEQRVSNQALNNAIKLAANFGLTPSMRTKIASPDFEDNTFKL